MEAIEASGLKLGVDPLGGASVGYWAAIRDRYRLDLTVTNEVVDPQFGFMTVDWDGRIRMDPSSPYAMARLVALKDRFDVAFANDTDADRHGIVAGAAGLMNPNHFLSAAVAYLYRNRDWRPEVAVGKTLVSTSMLDRVAGELGRRLVEVPVGFKWFVDGLVDGSLGFGGEESAGASFLRRDGTVWTTDKDGIIACLLAAELTARTGRNPGRRLRSPDRQVRGAGLSPHRRPGHARAEGHPGEALAGPGSGHAAGRRADHGRPDPRSRQRRPDRRGQGHHRARLVRGPPVRNGGRLQGLRRELPRRGASGPNPRGSPGGGRRGPGRGGLDGSGRWPSPARGSRSPTAPEARERAPIRARAAAEACVGRCAPVFPSPRSGDPGQLLGRHRAQPRHQRLAARRPRAAQGSSPARSMAAMAALPPASVPRVELT